MSLQREHFLLSYLKTLSVGPAGVRTHDLPHGSPVLNQLSQPVGGCILTKNLLFPILAGRFEEGVIEERRKAALELLNFAGNIPDLFTSQTFVKFFEVHCNSA